MRSLSVSGRRFLGTSGGAPNWAVSKLPLFSDLSGSTPGGAATFTRGSSQYATGDSILQQAVTNMPMFPGIRAVTNLWTESEFRNGLTDAPTRSANITATTLTGYAGAIYFPAGATATQYVYKSNYNLTPTRKYLLSADIQMDDLSVPRGYGSNNTDAANTDAACTISNGSASNNYYVGYLPLGNNVYRLFWYGVAVNNNALCGVQQLANMSDKAFKVSAYNLVDITGIPTTQAIEYVQTTTAQVTKFFAYTNPYTVSGGIVTQASGTPLSSQGFLSEPSGTNKCTCYGVPRADSEGSELVTNGTFIAASGGWSFDFPVQANLTGDVLNLLAGANTPDAYQPGAYVKGKIYKITYTINSITSGGIRIRTGSGGNYTTTRTTAGTYTETVMWSGSTAMIISGTTTSTAAIIDNISIKEQIDSIGVQAYYDTAFNNPITNMTLSGDTSAVLSIVDDTAELTSAGLLGLTNGGKVYKLDNPGTGGTIVARITIPPTVGSTFANTQSLSVIARSTTGTGGSSLTTSNTFGLTNITSATYTRISRIGAAFDASDQFSIRCGVGDTIYFILPTWEENPYTSTLMPSAGSAGSRAATALSLPVTGNLPVGTTGVTNLVKYSQDFSNAAWVKAGTAAVTGTNVINLPAGGGVDFVYTTVQGGNLTAGNKYLVSAKLSGVGSTSLAIYSGTTSQPQQFVLTSTPTVYSVVFTANATGSGLVYIRRYAGDTATQVTCDWYQVEDVTASGKTAFTTYTATTSASATDYPTTRHISFNWTPQYAGLLAPSGFQLPQYLWSTRVDANNYTAIWYNGTILAFEKVVGGVSEFAVYPLTAVVGTTYKIDGLINADNTLTIKVNGVAGSSGLGSELITHPIDITQVSPFVYLCSGTKTSALVATATTTSLHIYTQFGTPLTRGKSYQYLCTGVLSGLGTLGIYQSGATAHTLIGASGVQRSVVVNQATPAIGFRATSTTAGDTITISEFSVKEIYNNSSTMAPQIGSTMEIGSLNGVSNAYANFSNFAIAKR